MKVVLDLNKISGCVEIIPSKSVAHRKIIAATLSGVDVNNIYGSKDIEATKACMKSILSGENEYRCGESGSTLRFLLPLVGALGKTGTFITEGRLGERPIKDLADVLIEHGMKIEVLENGNIKASGQLKAGLYRIRADISSQYISGLLFALPLLNGDSQIDIIGKIESESYINMTLDVLSKSGIAVNNFKVKGNQKYNLKDLLVEGDWSNGAFWICAGALLDDGLFIKGLNIDSLQGDKELINILRAMGADITINSQGIYVKKGNLVGIEIDAADIPDLVPILSLVAAVAKGNTRIYNAGRLRLKESDRLLSTEETLKGLGANIVVKQDEIYIKGTKDKLEYAQGTFDSYNDHRIVMMLAVASIAVNNKIIINGSEAVNKSYPDFFNVIETIGGYVKITEE